MKHLAFLVIAIFAATAAFAQAPAKEPAKPEPMKKEAAKPEAAKPEPAKPEPAKEAAAAVAAKPAAPKKPRRWNEDARHCLDQGSNTDIIKCAEEFL